MSGLYKGPKDKIFEKLFLNHLPGNVRGILVSMTNKDKPEESIETKAQWADAIMEQLSIPPAVNTISETNQIAALESKLESMINAFKRLFQPRRSKQHDNNSKKENKDDICFFHRKHGNNRHENYRCIKPCKLNAQWKEARAQMQKN